VIDEVVDVIGVFVFVGAVLQCFVDWFMNVFIVWIFG